MLDHRRYIMYKLDILDDIEIPINWYIVYYGIRNGLLDIQVAKDYAIRTLETNDESSQEELELAWGKGDKLAILEKIEAIPYLQIESEKFMEEAKNALRLAILIYIRNNEISVDVLFQKVDLLYADFDYPADMDSFITYMPIKDEHLNIKYSKEEYKNRLLNNLDSFISEQIKNYQ